MAKLCHSSFKTLYKAVQLLSNQKFNAKYKCKKDGIVYRQLQRDRFLTINFLFKELTVSRKVVGAKGGFSKLFLPQNSQKLFSNNQKLLRNTKTFFEQPKA